MDFDKLLKFMVEKGASARMTAEAPPCALRMQSAPFGRRDRRVHLPTRRTIAASASATSGPAPELRRR